MKKTPIIITQCDVRFGFNVARSLTHHGYNIIAMGKHLPTMCCRLPRVIKEASYPDPFKYPQQYIDAINQIAEQYKCQFCIPVHEDIFIASRYHDQFISSLKVMTPNFEKLLLLHDKLSLFNLTKSLSFSTPTTDVLSEIDQIDAVIRNKKQCVIKPQYGEGTRGVYILNKYNFKKHAHKLKPLFTREPYLIQPYVNGCAVCVGLFAKNGSVLAISGHRRLREVPKRGGTSTARMTFHDDDLFKAISTFIGEIDFNGILMLEFKYSESDHRYYLLDANPRYWGGLSSHIRSGVDYPVIQMKAAENSISASTSYSKNIVESRWLLGDIRYFFESLFHGDFKDIKKMLSTSDVNEVFYEDFDSGWRVFFNQLLSYCRNGLSKYSKKTIERRTKFFQR